MRVELTSTGLTVQRQPGDPRFYTDHTFLYHVKNALNRRYRCDVIKRRLSADGHLMGDDTTPYLRARDWSFFIFDQSWQLRSMAQDFNREGEVFLTVQHNRED